jgi:recombination protein RecA
VVKKEEAGLKSVAEIAKKHGAGSIFSMRERVNVPLPHYPTGIPEVDNRVIGIGGVPRGRITEIYGPESGGKTTLALQVIASAQQQGDLAAFVDAEHSLDPTYAGKLGVNVDDLLVSQPDYGEQALDIVEILVKSGELGIIVIDSVAALVPKAELDGEMGDSHMGLQARLMGQAMRKLTGIVNHSGSAVIFINQIREKMNTMAFQSNETTTGGRALKFYSSLRLDVRRIGSVKDGEEIVGAKTKIKAVKNKVARPLEQAEIDLMYGRGFDGVANLFDLAVDRKLVDKAGAWFSYQGERIGQGRLAAIEFFREAKEKQQALREGIKQ